MIFSNLVKSNAGALAAIWAPIVLVSYIMISSSVSEASYFLLKHKYLPYWILSFQVYFMDAQIWYSVYCSVFGGVYGILHHLGEVSCF